MLFIGGYEFVERFLAFIGIADDFYEWNGKYFSISQINNFGSVLFFTIGFWVFFSFGVVVFIMYYFDVRVVLDKSKDLEGIWVRETFKNPSLLNRAGG